MIAAFRAVALAGLFWGAALAPAAAAESGDAGAFFTLSTGDLKAEAADARAEGKRGLLLFFEQEGCPGCIHMKRHVLSRSDVQAYYRRHFSAISIDIRGAVPIRDFAGAERPENAYAQALKVRATPALVFYDLSGNELVRLTGTIKTAEEFLLLGEFVTSGAYKTRTFAQYKTEKSTAPRKKSSMHGPSIPRPLSEGEREFIVQAR